MESSPKKRLKDIRTKIKDEIEEGLQIAFAEPPLIPDTEKELRDVYAPS